MVSCFFFAGFDGIYPLVNERSCNYMMNIFLFSFMASIWEHNHGKIHRDGKTPELSMATMYMEIYGKIDMASIWKLVQ